MNDCARQGYADKHVLWYPSESFLTVVFSSVVIKGDAVAENQTLFSSLSTLLLCLRVHPLRVEKISNNSTQNQQKQNEKIYPREYDNCNLKKKKNNQWKHCSCGSKGKKVSAEKFSFSFRAREMGQQKPETQQIKFKSIEQLYCDLLCCYRKRINTFSCENSTELGCKGLNNN